MQTINWAPSRHNLFISPKFFFMSEKWRCLISMCFYCFPSFYFACNPHWCLSVVFHLSFSALNLHLWNCFITPVIAHWTHVLIFNSDFMFCFTCFTALILYYLHIVHTLHVLISFPSCLNNPHSAGTSAVNGRKADVPPWFVSLRWFFDSSLITTQQLSIVLSTIFTVQESKSSGFDSLI